MSTHNKGFYEDLAKIIFELSSNIIKYASYFFCWICVFVWHLGDLVGFIIQLLYFRENAKQLMLENDALQGQMLQTEKDTIDVITFLKKEDAVKDQHVN